MDEKILIDTKRWNDINRCIDTKRKIDINR